MNVGHVLAFGSDLARRLVAHHLFSTSARETYAILAVVLVCVFFYDRFTRRMPFYRSPDFGLDAVYAVAVIGGFYGAMASALFTAITAGFHHAAQLVSQGAIRFAPWALRLAIFVIVVDFLRYWMHRALHALPVLWAFHQVHHSAERIHVLTTYRDHIVGYMLMTFCIFLPMLVLGPGIDNWLPLFVVMTLTTLLQHSGIDIGYGRFGKIFVSPRFHAVHHSASREDFDANYGVLFSFWDQMFGTARFGALPQRYGLGDDDDVPSGFVKQFFHPFARLLGRKASETAS
jgi:sterol desaturase/sphingolipid hydroxylase (fatty acid hydroxylase superfamily)